MGELIPNVRNAEEGALATQKRQKRGRRFFWCCVLVGIFVLLLLAINIPCMVPARATAQKNQCIANLKQIDGAVEEWAKAHNKLPSDTYSLKDPNILGYLKGTVLPACPLGGTYRAGKTIGHPPTCSFSEASGHSL